MSDASPAIVFLCVANSARSQIAEGLARASAPNGVRVFSAGSAPGTVNPLAVRVMDEIGISLASHRSKGMDDVPLDRARMIVTLCADEQCPVLPPGSAHLSWAMPDPAAADGSDEARLTAFRETRDEIARRIPDLWRQLNGDG